MRQILDIAFKDIRLISRDWLGMFFIFFFPLLMGLFFGFIYGGMSSDSADLELVIVDHDKSEMSEKFVTALKDTGNVTFFTREDDQAAMDDIRKGRRAGLVIIPKGYGESAGIFWPQEEEAPPLKIATDPSRQAEAGMLEGLVMQASGKLMQERFSSAASMKDLQANLNEQIQQFSGDEDAPLAGLELFSQGMGVFSQWLDSQDFENGEIEGAPQGFNLVNVEKVDVTRERSPEQEELSGLRTAWDISFPSAIMWGVLGCVSAFAISIVKERSEGTLMRLDVAPISRTHVLAGKAMACFLTVIAVNTVLIAAGYAFGMRPQSFGLLALAVVCMAVCFVGIMMVMSVIGKTEEAVGGAGWGINVMMAMFGGGMMPLAFMPGFMKTISNFSPVKWGVLSLEGAIWRGFTFTEILLPCGILIGIGITGLAIGSWILKRRQTF